ncbi:hypothetical protein [uncultured Microbacterium sp.]|uniref:hypothetical protein n=1 Tax=uncultured Microbacterium sp. TaxID=191216 RepID=UPI0028DB7220|nr:hypothetical protein [uncultured Microbacterium sp.]
MKGKIGLIVGLGAGYVLGTRAGQERYEQIKTQWLKVWNMDPVQERVDQVKGFVGDKAAAVPGAVWNGAVKIVKSVGSDKTPGQKLDSVIAAGKDVADDIEDAAEDVKDKVSSKSGSSAQPSASGTSKPAASAAKKSEG